MRHWRGAAQALAHADGMPGPLPADASPPRSRRQPPGASPAANFCRTESATAAADGLAADRASGKRGGRDDGKGTLSAAYAVDHMHEIWTAHTAN